MNSKTYSIQIPRTNLFFPKLKPKMPIRHTVEWLNTTGLFSYNRLKFTLLFRWKGPALQINPIPRINREKLL